MKNLYRIILICVAVLGLAGAYKNVQHFRGDAIALRIPSPDQETGVNRAVVFEGELRRGLELHPTEWETLLKIAGADSIQREYESALEASETALQYYSALSALKFQGKLLIQQGEMEKAQLMFEFLDRVSVVDPMVSQYLMLIYGSTSNWEMLEKQAIEAEIRWPNSFDSLVSLGNVALAKEDAELAYKYYRLALGLPKAQMEKRVFPRLYPVAAVRKNAAAAAAKIQYMDDWAQTP